MLADPSSWTRLLVELDAIDSGMGVWKNAERAIAGEGDIDYFAPRSRWPDIADAFASWAETLGLESLPPCLHRPWAVYLVAVDRDHGRLVQLDVRERLTLGRTVILDADDLARLLEPRQPGFRTLRPGAEATLKLLTKCVDGRGRLDEVCLKRESVAAGLIADPEGARRVVELLHRGRSAAGRLVRSIVLGNPDHTAARGLMATLTLGAVSRPDVLASLARYRRRRRSCPVLRWILAHGQLLPPDVERWISDVRHGHDAGIGDRGGDRGMFLMLVGPDGVGKTTLRQALTARLADDHRVWSGRMSGPFTASRRSRASLGTTPAAKVPSRVPSWIRVLYLFVDTWLGWVTRTRRWLRDGGWVITERGWWDIAAYPARYRLRRVGRLHRALGSLGPRPDLILVLEAEPDTVRARKDELSPDEVRRQAEAWRSILPRHQRRVYLDASLPADVLTEISLAEIDRAPSRHRVASRSS